MTNETAIRAESDPASTIANASKALHIALLLVLAFLHDLGWDTREIVGRLDRTQGVVVADSSFQENRSFKGGGHVALYETRVRFTDQAGVRRGFRSLDGIAHVAGESVIVEYARNRPELARINGRRDSA